MPMWAFAPLFAAFIAVACFAFCKQSSKRQTSSDTWDEHVLPHDSALTEIVEGQLWVLHGTLKPPIKLPRCMAVFRPSGTRELFIHSPIACSEEVLSQILSLGTIRMIVIPNSFHRLDARVWSIVFPDAQVLCPRAAIDAVAAALGRHPDGTCEDVLPTWKPKVDGEPFVQCLKMSANATELAYLLDVEEERGSSPDHSARLQHLPISGKGVALVVCDALFNIEKPLGHIITDKILGSTGFFGVGRIGLLMLWWTGSRGEFAASLRKLAQQQQPILAVVVGHGSVRTKNCNAELLRIADELA